MNRAKGTGDRRVRRTRAALQEALARLMVERNYDDVTVDDICATADVGRSAFYAHYRGKDDLLRRSFARLEDDLLHHSGASEAGDGPAAFGSRFFAHALAHRPLYRAMIHSQAATIAAVAIRRILKPEALAALAPVSPAGAPNDLRARMLVDLLISTTRWWLDRDPLLPLDRIDAIFQELARGIIGEP